VSETVEGGYEQPGGEIDDKAERDLRRDQSPHEPAPRLPFLSFQRVSGFNLRNTQRRRQGTDKGHDERQERGKERDTPIQR